MRFSPLVISSLNYQVRPFGGNYSRQDPKKKGISSSGVLGVKRTD